MKESTLCVHAGTALDETAGGINTPIHTSSAYKYHDRQQIPYPRHFNTPNQLAVVGKLCALEKAEDGLIFASGMAAISTAVLAFAHTGDHVLLMDELYGGTHALAVNEFQRRGIDYSFTASSADALIAAVNDNTKVIVLESPTNPLLSIIDIRKVAEFARQRTIVTVFDNTFASPINQNPLEMGIDVVIHSATKYLGGHSDLAGGALLASCRHIETIRHLAQLLGGSLDAQACYLLERSIKTLALRVTQQNTNALQIAKFLAAQRQVKRVYYPGLISDSGHSLACSQMSGFGGMLSFSLYTDHTRPFLDRLQLIYPAISLGGVESSISSPSLTSHVKMSALERTRVGIHDSLLRLSVGIEDTSDLVADLQQALASGM